MENLAAFILAATLIELTPGPNMTFLALISSTEGRRYGVMTSLGVALGLLIVGLLVAFGLATAISESPFLFQLLRWGGIAYLLYLAWEGFRDSRENSPHRSAQLKTDATYFRHGLVVNLLNPKAAFFYVAILPTFLPGTGVELVDVVTLTVVYVIIATIIHLMIVCFAASFHPFLSDPVRNSRTRKILSLALVAVAVWFGWSTRQGL